MVYFTLQIVVGALLSKEDLVKFGADFEDADDDDEYPYLGEDILEGDIKIFRFPGHSKTSTKLYLVGIPLHTYYHRVDARCDQCTLRNACDTCLGRTNNGVYDILSITEQPTEVPLENVCFECYSDNRESLGGPEQNVPVVDGRCIGDPEAASLKSCKTCGSRVEWRFCPETVLKRDYHYEQLDRFLSYPSKKGKKVYPIKLYFMADDCVCCS